MVPTLTERYNPPSPIGSYIRALLFTLILGLVGAIALTVFQGSPPLHAAPASALESGQDYAAPANQPAAIDAQPIN